MSNLKKHFMYGFLSCFMLSGCSGVKPSDFRDTKPVLSIEKYFSGDTYAWGIFEDRFGSVKKQFSVDIHGVWDGKELRLDEKFLYSDGEKDRRIWRIKKLGKNSYEGFADDVFGAARGQSYGNAFNWQYQMDLDINGLLVRVNFNDWMFLQESGVLINRAKVTKWGIDIGEVTLFFSKKNVNSPM